MQIYLGSDHGGYKIKEMLEDYLKEEGHQVLDVGLFDAVQKVDYPDIAREVSEKVLENEGSVGFLVCGTGMGVCMAANKLKGIRAVTVHDVSTARLAKQHNNANVITMGERVVGEVVARDIVDAFLEADFEGDRHMRRLDKIKAIEDEQ